MISNLPSHFRQQEAFIRPLVEERFAKMEELGENWDDKPVRESTSLDLMLSSMERNRMTCSCG